MDMLTAFRDKYQNYLDKKSQQYSNNVKQYFTEDRQDEANFEKVKESTVKNIMFNALDASADLCIKHKTNKLESSHQGLWDIFMGKIGKTSSYEECFYKIFNLYWIQKFSDETKLLKENDSGNNEAYMKEKCKLDTIQECTKDFKNMAKEYFPYNESWEVKR